MAVGHLGHPNNHPNNLTQCKKNSKNGSDPATDLLWVKINKKKHFSNKNFSEVILIVISFHLVPKCPSRLGQVGGGDNKAVDQGDCTQ